VGCWDVDSALAAALFSNKLKELLAGWKVSLSIREDSGNDE
jgi:hypothetical protein